MEPKADGPASQLRLDGSSSSGMLARDINVDPSPPTSPPDRSVLPATAAPTESDDGLEDQTREFLLQRVRALERQLTIRNSDCARLLAERQELMPLKDKCASQKEMILALKGQLDLARAQRESAVDAMEAMKRRQRDQEHRDRIQHAERAMYGTQPSVASPAATTSGGSSPMAQGNTSGAQSRPAPQPAAAALSSSMPNIGRRNPGGTLVNTAAGPQVLYDSSDITSVGFAKNARLPYDFLGGPGAQQQYMARYRGQDNGDVPDGGHDASEDAQVRRVIDAAKDQAEMEAKYAEMESKEEEALMARIKALREGRK